MVDKMKETIFFLPENEEKTTSLTMKVKNWKRVFKYMAENKQYKKPSEAIEFILERFFDIKEKKELENTAIAKKGDWE